MSIRSQTPGVASDRPLLERDRTPNYMMGKKEKKMPLNKSDSEDAIGENIDAEERAGKPFKQSVAIALDVARKSKRHNAEKRHEHHSNHHRHKEHR